MEYKEYILDTTKKLLSIDSPSGFTTKVTSFLLEEYTRLGYKPVLTNKGGVVVDLGGNTASNDGIMLMAHVDTLGGMVHEIKSNGRLRLTPIGGLTPPNIETENVRVYTRFSGEYEGTFQLENAAVHVNDDFDEAKRTFDTMEVVLDELVESAEDTKKLGIMAGDIVCFDPRTVITKNGYIKSRFLDDKLSAGILLGYAKYLKDECITPKRHTYINTTVYEEVGHGAACNIPADVLEVLSVDMGCVGDGLSCTERTVSICAKDSRGPYNYDVTTALIKAAMDNNIDYAVDIYPHYGSDADVALTSGHDVKHGLIGAGVYASHGYERSHIDGMMNTFKLIKAYLT